MNRQYGRGNFPIDEGEVRELATGTFLDARRNAIFIGGTGTGKTHLCIAVAAAVIRSRARGRFFNLVDLVNQLEQEKAAGRSGRLAEKLLRQPPCSTGSPTTATSSRPVIPAGASRTATDPDFQGALRRCAALRLTASRIASGRSLTS